MGPHKDLWLAVREGCLADVDLALIHLKKNGGNINSRNIFGSTPLHIATWRNHIPIVRRLVAAGADPDARDGESGWSSLHRALHFGHLAVASILIQSGASITLEDSKSRTPVDLISGPVSKIVGNKQNSVTTDVFSWGSGANYQLGTGNEHIQKLPCKVDSLQGSFIKLLSAAKFHSIAVTTRGEVYTWGFGRGGRLGHPEFDIHSGQAAVITPRLVTHGLGARRVKAIAAAKHHTVLATEGGEVFSWGSNREGQLGYTSVDTQPTPRRVSSLKSKIVAVAAANKHTAVVSESGEVFTWGCNREGQLGYGTSNSASNYIPRLVEYLKGRSLVAVAAAKYHTIVLGADGEVYTWGHRLVTPRRVVINRNLKKSGSTPLKFHRMERLHVTALAAGMVHSMALIDDGALFYWVSSDPSLKCEQLYSLSAKNMVSISAGKYWTAAVTATGEVYMWDGKQGKDRPPVATRLPGMKRATSVSVGETHLLTVGSLYHPTYLPSAATNQSKLKLDATEELKEFDEDFMFSDMEPTDIESSVQKGDSGPRLLPSLKSLCEKVAAEYLVEPRNSLELLEIADSLGAEDLRRHCEEIVIRNLDFILTVTSQAFASASPDILANLEKLLDSNSSEAWSYRRLPTPTATFPVVISSDEEESGSELLRIRDNHIKKSLLNYERDPRSDSFLQPKDDPNAGITKHIRALSKKLQQIEILEAKQSSGCLLDDQQMTKLQTRTGIERSLAELGNLVDMPPHGKEFSSISLDGRNKKAEVSKKPKRKSKQKLEQPDSVSTFTALDVEANTDKDMVDIEITQSIKNKDRIDIEIAQANKNKEEDAFLEGTKAYQPSTMSAVYQKKDSSQKGKHTSSLATTTKKKSKKGGLSMFLSGALDDTSKEVTPPPTPKYEGPAWGGAKVLKGSTSLREIQDEQIKTQVYHPIKSRNQVDDLSLVKSEGKILLSSFLTSKPIPVSTSRTVQASDGEKNTPPWASSGTPPHLSRPSLRDIQQQQFSVQCCTGALQLCSLRGAKRKGKKKQSIISLVPKTSTAGFSVASTGQGSPSDSPGSNRWFKPEIESPSSIRSIQIEEKAIKDLKRFYSSVKIVKNES